MATALWLTGAIAAPITTLQATTEEPRAYGYQLGDLASRAVTLQVPDGLVLDEASLPRTGVRGPALELRRIDRPSASEAGGTRIELTLTYQVFVSPPQVRTLEMPPVTLQFKGRPRAQSVRIDAWPLTVAPLAPVEAAARRGLGDLQPDAEPPLIDIKPALHRLIGYALVALLAIGALACIHFGVPWWSRAHRPFAEAWRAVRGLRTSGDEAFRRTAYQRLHEALNRTAGEVLFAHGIDRFVAARPQFTTLRADFIVFFERSRQEFFGASPARADDLPWLIDFCRRCRDAERGSA
jgi:mxaA protein